jgi:MFS family permease
LLVFVLWEARVTAPMIPLGLFRERTFAAALRTQFLTSGSIFSAAFITSQYFQLGQGHSPLATGLRFLPWTATPLLVAPAAGALFDRVGARRLVVPGLLMQAVGLGWIVRLAGSGEGYGSYVAPFLLAGVGVSMALPCLPAAALNAAPPALLGKAAGLLNTVQLFGSTFAVALVTVVFTANGSLAGPAAVTAGFQPALAVSAGLSALGAVTALAIRRAGRSGQRTVLGSGIPESSPASRPRATRWSRDR